MTEVQTVVLAEETIGWIIIAAAFGGYWATRAWDYLKNWSDAI